MVAGFGATLRAVDQRDDAIGTLALLGLLCAAVASLYACVRAAAAVHWKGVFAGIFCAAATLIMSVNLVILPGIAGHESLRSFVAAVRQALGRDHELFFFRTFQYDAVFYWQDHIPIYEGPWPAGAPRYLLMERREWERTRPSVNDQYEQVTFADGAAADSLCSDPAGRTIRTASNGL